MVNYTEYTDIYENETKNLLLTIAVEEYGFYEWKECFLTENLNRYKENNGSFWIAISEDNKVVGTVGIEYKSPTKAALKKMYVDKDYRGQGISKNLIDLAITHCREKGYKRLIVGTSEKMERATVFYKKNGFMEYKRSENGDLYYYLELI